MREMMMNVRQVLLEASPLVDSMSRMDIRATMDDLEKSLEGGN